MSCDATPIEYDVGVARRTRRPSAEEQAFLAAYDPAAFPPVAVTVDVVILTVQHGQLCVLLVRRGTHPYLGHWALPGGFVTPGETLDEAAARELAEETGVRTGGFHLEQLGSYGDPGRDPRMRVVSVAYLALVPDPPAPVGGTDASDARLWPIAHLGTQLKLAFDHERIVGDAVERARAKLEYTSVATSLLGEPFTIGDLRRVYEAVWGIELHAANFRRKVLATPGFVIPTGEQASTGRGWTDQYTAGPTAALYPAILRPAR
jgi:8-oxo-dGTP diphosphatase